MITKELSSILLDNRKGQLSTRMLLPGNTWQTVWETAKPVPARRQVISLKILNENIAFFGKCIHLR